MKILESTASLECDQLDIRRARRGLEPQGIHLHRAFPLPIGSGSRGHRYRDVVHASGKVFLGEEHFHRCIRPNFDVRRDMRELVSAPGRGDRIQKYVRMTAFDLNTAHSSLLC